MNLLDHLAGIGAVFQDKHFIYTSGKHGSAYINLDPMFPDAAFIAELSDQLIAPYLGKVDTVVAPATGGIVLSVQTALAFHRKGETVASVWADKADGGFEFERAGFVEQIRNKRVLVIEDLLNTGGSVEKTCRLVEKYDGKLVGVSVVCNRGSSTPESLQVPELHSTVNVQMSVYEPDSCPMCEAKKPIVDDIGHGSDYKKAHADYAGGFISLVSESRES